MSVPTVPQGLVSSAQSGLILLNWSTPSSDGGPSIQGYEVQWATASTFAVIDNLDSRTVDAADRYATITMVWPGTWYYRVRAYNSDGNGAWTATQSIVLPHASTLDNVQGAAVVLDDGTRVELRTSGSTTPTWPTVTLGYTTFLSTTFTQIGANVPTLTGALGPTGGERALALVADPAGNLYVIGRRHDHFSTVMMLTYARTGPLTWAAPVISQQSIGHTGERLRQFAACWVPGAFGGSGGLFLMVRRSGPQGTGALSWALIDPATTGPSALFSTFGSDPSWLATPPSSTWAHDLGPLDVTYLGDAKVAILANGASVVSVVSVPGRTTNNIASQSKEPNGTYISGQWGHVLAIDASTYAAIAEINGGNSLRMLIRSYSGTLLRQVDFSSSLILGGSYDRNWSAYYDRAAGLIRLYYLAAAGAGALHMLTYSPSTFTQTAGVLAGTFTATGASREVRIPSGLVDERRVAVQVSNVTGTTLTQQALYATPGNKAPNAPSVTDVVTFDAASAYTFRWAPSDPNTFDVTQNGGTFRIERVSDSVEVYTAALTAGQTSKVLPAATLTNGLDYRWQVRTTDVLGAVGAYSAFDTFTTSALGTLTITAPAADNPAGLEVSTYPLAWSFVQASGYVQTQRRVRVIRVSDSVVLSDTTMQASTAATYTIPNLPSGVPVQIELSIVTNAPGTPTVTATRLLTTNYDMPMTPTVAAETGATFCLVTVTNPAPTGDRPDVVRNYIERRRAGTSDPFVAVAVVGPDASYEDRAVGSGLSYEYRARGVTE